MQSHSLSTLLADYHLPLNDSCNFPIKGLALDTRHLNPGEVFLAYPGISTDGRHYIPHALAQGAAAILYEPCHFSAESSSHVPLIAFPELKDHAGALAARWFNYPTRHFETIGVTGTNGKTSCTHFLAHSLMRLNRPCGVLGTVGAGFPQALKSSALTTPHVIEIQRLAAELLAEGAKSLAMEVSSHALVQGRVNSVNFTTAIFTNLTQDHLDYHGTMAAYGAAKAQLFHWPSLQHAVVNLDDPFGYELYLELKAQPSLYVIGYTTQPQTLSLDDHVVLAKEIQSDRNGIQAQVTTPWGEGQLKSQLIGHFHLHNLLAVLATLGALCHSTHSLPEILTVMADLSGVPGRMQCAGGDNKPLVVVDYAHTPDALLNVLQALRAYKPRKLWCVFGCGGDRDIGKRAMMGQIAAEFCDKIIVTNDNPRTESPEKIVQDIISGIKKDGSFVVEYDRAKAIELAVMGALAHDIVLVAGKGHEDYQIIGHERFAFSDIKIVEELLLKQR